MSPKLILITILVLPILNTLVLLLLRKRNTLRNIQNILIACINLLLSIILYNLYLKGVQIQLDFITLSNNIKFSFYLENLSLLFAIMVNFLWIVSIIYSIGYMNSHGEHHQTRFFIFFSLAIVATLGIAFSSNLFTAFLFYEILTISTFPLVGHHINKDNKKSLNTYLRVLITTSLIFFLPAIILTFIFAGTTNFTNGGVFFDKDINPYFILIILILFIFGIAKAAIMPFHKWLPAAMIAPTPVSALLHAVAVVKSGVFLIIKIISLIFGSIYIQDLFYKLFSFNFLVIIPSITIVLASLIAVFQDNIKKRLAYSTISQLSYIVLGVLILNETGILAAKMHLFAHAFGKITLFFAAGSIIVLSHKTQVSQLNGIAKQMPITMIAFSIGALSMIGFPLTIGSYSKHLLVTSGIQANNYIVIAVIILSTILNAMYFLPIIGRAFFGKLATVENDEIGIRMQQDIIENPQFNKSILMDLAMIITSSLVIILMLYHNLLSNFLISF